ncbi:hypothetical protein ES703_27075 [subsurface metagenome]
MLLSKVADAHVRADSCPARRGRLLASDDAQQGGLARAVWPHQSYALASPKDEIDLPKEDLLAKALAQPLKDKHILPACWSVHELEPHLPGLSGLFHMVFRFQHTLDSPLPNDGLASDFFGDLAIVIVDGFPFDLAGMAFEFSHRALQPGDALLLLMVGLPMLLVLSPLGPDVGSIVAWVGSDGVSLGIHLQDAGHRIVQESPVVRHDQHGPLVPPQVVLQPLQPGDVQVIGGLVQKEEGRVLEQDACQAQASSLTTAQDAHRRGRMYVVEAQVRQNALDGMFRQRYGCPT